MTPMSEQATDQTVRTEEPAAGQLLRSFGLFIELEKRARHAGDEAELQFLLVNETFNLARFRQALLWRRDPARGRIAAVSGLATVDPNTPFIAWAERLCLELDSSSTRTPRPLAAADLSGSLAADWHEWLPPYALWLPLYDGATPSPGGALLLVRDQPWTEAEQHLLGYLADAYGHAWTALRNRRRQRFAWLTASRRHLWLILGGLLLFCALLPIRQSALAPAEVIARDPVMIRAPLDGVVDRFEVQPNQKVVAGQPLLRLDATRLTTQLEVARKTLEVTEAELRQASQQAFFDERSKANLALIKGRMEQHAEEVAYVESLLQRIEIRAPREGLAIFDNVNDWVGRPVVLGERILMVADPQAVELEIRLPVADALTLEQDSPVRLFLNIAPQKPLDARLHYASYQASLTANNILAYRLLARFEPGMTPVRIGLKGTAKVYGEQTILAFYLLRRPFGALRQFLGW